MGKIARVILDSPLPSLDKVFDYAISDELQQVLAPGVRVRVPFGRSKQKIDGYVVEVADSSDFAGKLSELSELVSPLTILPSNLYKLLRTLADRQASTLGDLLSTAVAQRFVRVEKAAISATAQVTNQPAKAKLEAILANPTLVDSDFVADKLPQWVETLLGAAKKTLEDGFSVIVLVPDYRDQDRVKEAILGSALAESLVDFSSEQTGSARYSAYLKCLTEGAHLVVGSRSAAYAPVQNLGLIAMFDDGDRNFQDQQSPYLHARDTALVRQSVDNCSMLFVSHARSTEVQRLVDLGFLQEVDSEFTPPKVAFDETTARVSTLAWQAIREGLETGVVLVQVSSRGVARTAYCEGCSTRALCNRCHGPIWIDARSMPRCRWCNAQNLAFSCPECKSTKLKQGYGGATRTAAEFGTSFAGVQIIESSGDNNVLEVSGKNKIVISTPGAEPKVAEGYSRVIIIDAKHALNRDSLRASEDAVREWSNAIAKLAPQGRAVIVGVPSQLGSRLSLWQQREIAGDELANRRELDFPPHLRLGSIEGPVDVIAQIAAEVAIDGVQFLGPISLRSKTGENQHRLVMKYSYSRGAELSEALRAAQLKVSAGMTKTSASGRVSRAIRVRMDDPEVI
jgi:primosomal protein N' (replication factor Y)